MPCCEDGKPCGGPAYHVSPDDAVYAAAQSRYPKVLPRAHSWKAAENGAPQFEDYDDGLRRRADDEDDDGAGEPFEYSGEHLAACNFPLGSFGTGRILLCGDGTMKEWTVVNQVRTDDGGPGDAPQPLDDMPANFFAISATPAGGKAQSFALVTPQNYTDANAALPVSPSRFFSRSCSLGRVVTPTVRCAPSRAARPTSRSTTCGACRPCRGSRP